MMTKSNVKNTLRQKVTKRLKISKDVKAIDQVTLHRAESKNPWYIRFTNNDDFYNKYMATEWGFEERNDNALFEKLCLEGAQAGLSWRTILNKREAYRQCFHNFDIVKVSNMSTSQIDEILSLQSKTKRNNDVVVKHRGKLEAIVNNAKQILTMVDREEGYTTFSDYLWSFVNDQPILNRWSSFEDIPSKSKESEEMSRALKSHGFKFVGPTTCYSLMQSCGFVIDHPVDTPEWQAAFERLHS